MITALHTGLRRGEILGLRWDQNIDLKNGFILLEKTKTGARREIPISNTLRSVLQGVPRRLDIPYVFFNPKNGKCFKEIKRSFETAKKKVETMKCPACDYQSPRLRAKEDAGHCPQCGEEIIVIKGLQDYNFHDNRHTFASRLVMEGVDIVKVSKLLGHKSLSMTLRYAHLAPSRLVGAIGVLDKALSKSISTNLAQKKGAIS